MRDPGSMCLGGMRQENLCQCYSCIIKWHTNKIDG